MTVRKIITIRLVLPGGRGVLFTIVSRGQSRDDSWRFWICGTGQWRTLIRAASQAEYVETGSFDLSSRRGAVGRRLRPDDLQHRRRSNSGRRRHHAPEPPPPISPSRGKAAGVRPVRRCGRRPVTGVGRQAGAGATRSWRLRAGISSRGSRQTALASRSGSVKGDGVGFWAMGPCASAADAIAA